MKNFKKTVYNFSFSLLSQLITISLGLIILRITLLNYGSEVNGLMNSVTQFVAYLSLFEAGIQMVAMQALYRPIRNDNTSQICGILAAVNKNYKKTGFYYLISLIVLSVIYPFIAHADGIRWLTVFSVVLFSGLGNVVLFFVQGKYKILLQAEGKTYIITNIQTLISVITSVIKIILLSLGWNVAFIVGVSFIVSLLQAVYIVVYINKKYKWIDLSVAPDNYALRQKGSALIHQISSLIFQNTDVLILTVFCGLKVVSVYSIYKMIVGQISSILNIPFTSFSFHLGQLYNTDIKKYKETIDVVEVYYSALVFSIYTVTACLLLPFVSLYTRGISDIKYVDKFLALLFVASELLNFMRMAMLNTINYAGHFRKTLSQTITESVINLVLSLVAVARFGIYGVLIGTVAALLYRTTIIIIYSNRKLLDRRPWKTFFIYFVNFALLFALLFVYLHLKISIDSYAQFALVGLIATPVAIGIFMLILSIVFRNESARCFRMLKTIIVRYKNKGTGR